MSTSLSLPVTGTYPTVAVAGELPAESDVVVVHLFKSEDSAELASTGVLDDATLRSLYASLTAVGATGKANELTRVPAPEGVAASVVVAVGLGDPEEITDETVRRAAGTLARSLAGSEFETIAYLPHTDALAATTEGVILGGYRYRGIRSEAESDADSDPAKTQTYTVVSDDTDAQREVEQAVIVANSVNLARDFSNTPANFLYPEVYAELLTQAGQEAGLEVEVLDEKELAGQGYGGIIAVGQGSQRPPRLVRLTYSAGADAPHVALVGKGITFDTGGISLKPASRMENMISDMSGSSSMAAAVIAAARLELPVNVTATVALAENMPSGSATRPGDVITHYGGVTSEILNTDAEGRLVLADAIARACEDKPQYLIEASTLTGAQLVALGGRTAAVMGSDDFRDTVAAAGREVGESAWAMPLLEEHEEEIKSPIADLRNVNNSREGGMCYAGTYLSHFVADEVEWAHIDIAGPAWNDGAPRGYTPKRATGQPVRTVLKVLSDVADAAAKN